MLYEQSIKGVFDAIADIHKRLHKLEKKTHVSIKQPHPLDKVIDEIICIADNLDIRDELESFRYESIKWALGGHDWSVERLNSMLIARGKEHWIVKE